MNKTTLHPDWKATLTKAWSIKLIGLSVALSSAEAALPLISQIIPVPPGTFAALSAVVTALAALARVVVQPK